MSSATPNFESRIEALDLSLFDTIATQSVEGDRLAWLQCQRLVRKQTNGYCYLEIGSHLGGSIQQHLIDPQCRHIFSIDKRPPRQPDDRGQVYEYEGNSTQRMLDNLRTISSEDLDKIKSFDSDAAEVDLQAVQPKPDLAFIDGEHTKAAALSDFQVCLQAIQQEGLIGLHDDDVIWPAIEAIGKSLQAQGIPHRSLKLGGSTFLFLLGSKADEHYQALSEFGIDGREFVRRQRSELRKETWIRRPVRKLIPPAIRKAIKPLIGA